MAITFGSEFSGTTAGATSFGCTSITTIPIGSVIAVAVHVKAGSSVTVSSVTDSAGNTYTFRVAGFQSGSNSRCEWWTAPVTSALVSGTVTVNLSGSAAARASCSEWVGAASPVVVDASNSFGTAATTTPPACQITATDPGDVVLAAISYPNATAPSAGPDNGFTTLSGGTPAATFYGTAARRIITATGTYGPAWTLPASVASGSATIALKPAAGGGGGGGGGGPASILMPTITVEALFDPLLTTWTDLSAYVRSFEITRGSSRYDGPLLRFEAGTATVVLSNTDFRFNPADQAFPIGTGVYVDGNGSQLRPGKWFRIKATYGGTTYTLWKGRADAWDCSWPGGGKGDGICTLTGTDLTKFLQDGTHLQPYVGAVETSGARIEGLLNWIVGLGIPITVDATQLLLIDTGLSNMQAGTVTADWDSIQAAADNEIGQLYVRGDGYIVFHQRDVIALAVATGSTVVVGDGGGTELKFQDIHLVQDDVQIKNFVTATISGGSEQFKSDNSSWSEYGIHSADYSGLLLTTDTEAKDYAGYIVATSSGARNEGGALLLYGDVRIDRLEVDPRIDPTNLYPQVLGRDLTNLITVKFRPPGIGSLGGTAVLQRNAFIIGIQHTASPTEWKTVWSLMDATDRFKVFIFDHAQLGRLDYNYFGA